MKYFIANWKANKNLVQANQWLDEFLTFTPTDKSVRIVICPPFSLLYPVKEKISKFSNIYLGAQDLSQYEEGSFTGEVTVKTLSGLVDYAIIGHSERRKYFAEKYDLLLKKTNLAKKYDIEPVFCIRDEKDQIPEGVEIVAYEPLNAIGTGQNEPVERVLEMKKKLQLTYQISFLYGGSLDKNNATAYLKSGDINGLLIGGSSLNPSEFYDIVNLT